MADVTSVFKLIYNITTIAKEINDTVNANYELCLILKKRVKIVADLAEQLKTKVKDISTMQASIQQALDCLIECSKFIKEFSDTGRVMKFIKSGSYKAKFKMSHFQVLRTNGVFLLW